MISITDQVISPELVVNSIRNDASGCVVTYVGLIRNVSQGKSVLSVEYEDTGLAEAGLREIAGEVSKGFPVNGVAICHRVGRLKVGDINLVIAVAAAHREEGFSACQYAIDLFKKKLPTRKTETYVSSGTCVEEA
jgi:molybdopterin synthase catalytic subunit